jgi:hypothetical protein
MQKTADTLSSIKDDIQLNGNGYLRSGRTGVMIMGSEGRDGALPHPVLDEDAVRDKESLTFG